MIRLLNWLSRDPGTESEGIGPRRLHSIGRRRPPASNGHHLDVVANSLPAAEPPPTWAASAVAEQAHAPVEPMQLLQTRQARHVEVQIKALVDQVDSLQNELRTLRLEADKRRQHLTQVEHELKLAGRLQADFLPKSLPHKGIVQFNRLFRAAGHVSGDLYDICRLDEQHVGVFLVDAMGHGMPAGLLAMFMHSVFRPKRINPEGGYTLLPSDEVIASLNEILIAQKLAHSTFATAVYACVNMSTGEVHLARGGHPLPLLLRADGAVEEVACEGALLGVLPDESFQRVSLTLQPGERLIFFSDGLDMPFLQSDCLNSGWRQALEKRSLLSTDEMLTSVWQHLDALERLEDDITLVTVEMPAQKPPASA